MLPACLAIGNPRTRAAASARARSRRGAGALGYHPRPREKSFLTARSTSASAYLAILASALLFSTGGAAIKATTLTSWQVASFRSGIAAVALLVFLKGARRRPSAKSILTGVVLASTLLLFVHANKLTTAANTVFLQSTAPLWILALAPRLLGERPRRADVIFSAFLALGAVAFFLGTQQPFATAPDPRTGNLMALVSGFTWALALMGLRWVQWGDDDAIGATGVTVVCGNVLTCLAGLPLALSGPIDSMQAKDVAVVLYLGVFQVGAAYALMTGAVKRLSALEVALFMLLEPVASSLLAWWLHGERPGPWALAGGALIIGSTAWRAVSGSMAARASVSPGA